MTSNRSQAEAAAADLIARRERDDWSAADEAKLQAWVAASLDHRVAWLRLQAAWQEMQRLKALVRSAPRGSVPTPEEIRQPFFDTAAGQESGDAAIVGGQSSATPALMKKRHAARHLGIAAGLVLLISAAVTWQLWREPGYHTTVGAMQSVPLPDGSRMMLNTNTNLNVDVTPTERRVNLEQGEAFFEVAKDPKRPFIVMAGNRRVVAVGTRFSVRRDGDEVSVYVTEGTVRFEKTAAGHAAAAQNASGIAEPEQVLLHAGAVARAESDAVLVRERSIAEVEQLLSWRSGYLVFDKTPLSEAVAEFNRYNARQVVIEDPRIAAIPVGGNFRATNVDAFVRLIASDNAIAASVEGNQIILSAMPPP